MACKVVITAEARLALVDAQRWLLQAGSGAQDRARWLAIRAAGTLADLPYKGTAVPGRPGLRQLVVSDHRLLFRVQPDTGSSETAGDIIVLTLFGPGQR